MIKTPQDTIDRIIQMYAETTENGHPKYRVKDISAACGVSEQVISKAARKAGILRRQRRFASHYNYEAIAADLKAGMPISDICIKHGCGSGVVRSARKAAGLPKRSAGNPAHKSKYTAIADDYRRGMKFRQLRKRHKASFETIKKAIAVAGLDPPEPTTAEYDSRWFSLPPWERMAQFVESATARVPEGSGLEARAIPASWKLRHHR